VTEALKTGVRRWVLLRHELPGGEWHYDWMIQRSDEADAPLLTFRVFVRPDDATVLEFAAERLGDHRAVYLEYEGEVSGGRGRVDRVAAGVVESLRESAERVDVRLAGVGEWRGARVEGTGWEFRRG
jgi:hypothetical protein